MEAEVTLEYGSARVARAVADAVSADNLKAPSSMTVETVCDGTRVLTKIRFEGKLATFIATVDDLLFSVSTAEKALCVIEKLG